MQLQYMPQKAHIYGFLHLDWLLGPSQKWADSDLVLVEAGHSPNIQIGLWDI